MAKFKLNTRLFCYRMQRNDGKGEFVSTRCCEVDNPSHLHSIAIDPMTWDAMVAEGINALDAVIFEGDLVLPVKGTQEWNAAQATVRATGEVYTAGDVRNGVPVDVVKSFFKNATFPKFADLPQYQKRSTGPESGSLSV